MTKLSPLQIERLKYQPKLPASLQNGINSLEMIEGNPTQSVANQQEIQNLFSNTYGKPTVEFKQSASTKTSEAVSDPYLCLLLHSIQDYSQFLSIRFLYMFPDSGV